ncbi:MAG: hypothetical protein B5766_03945 [Candidatus Lumbricidophila eiseniae]|uniref:Signal peptidase I n=1 Tax=Candidatus Lumbricidiphila eiseniae TaxID=1969409 RepID=A0A2A6FT51_9MICO|nr:MAG: hypothetical protein B5766_03945 [Candidatus Lumbricidophila eiseniae]
MKQSIIPGRSTRLGKLFSRPRRTSIPVRIILVGSGAIMATALLIPATSGGYIATITNSTNRAASATFFTCTAATLATGNNAYFAYRLNDSSLSLFADDYSSNATDGTYVLPMLSTTTTSPPCPRDTGSTNAYTPNGLLSMAYSPTTIASPNTFTLEIWFKTTVAGGYIMGLANTATGIATQKDRHLYLGTTGRLIFGVHSGSNRTVTSPQRYDDGVWHQAIATLSAGIMRLYVDGAMVGIFPGATPDLSYTGYWRIGQGNLNTWPVAPINTYFSGQLRYAAAYPIELSAAQVAAHYVAGK